MVPRAIGKQRSTSGVRRSKVQGHMRSQVQKHRSRPLSQVQGHTTSDGNVTLKRGRGCCTAHSFLDFVVNRFFMKLFQTNNIYIIKSCQLYFSFQLPSAVLSKCVAKFMCLADAVLIFFIFIFIYHTLVEKKEQISQNKLN